MFHSENIFLPILIKCILFWFVQYAREVLAHYYGELLYKMGQDFLDIEYEYQYQIWGNKLCLTVI